jgi:hypothetical protein
MNTYTMCFPDRVIPGYRDAHCITFYEFGRCTVSEINILKNLFTNPGIVGSTLYYHEDVPGYGSVRAKVLIKEAGTIIPLGFHTLNKLLNYEVYSLELICTKLDHEIINTVQTDSISDTI